jgi:phosphate transport system protein
MAEFGIRMVHDALTAFVERDAEKATEIARRDDELDNMKNQMLNWVLEIMESHPKSLRTGIDFLFLNRFLERLGDHVTNMCEWIVYSRRGEHIELNT